MLSRRLASSFHVMRRARPRTALRQVRWLSPDDPDPDPNDLNNINDPNMNGGYINPPRMKRQFRDPYADWDDPQERRNFGEPVHEDEDILGMFSPEEYTHTSPGWAAAQLFMFVGAVFGLAGIVSLFYPDKPSYPRDFEDGLEEELGGPGALRARKDGDPV
ncbi:MAG: hypothetical protein M1826_007780 [Phylliscum demangeonii]|nr:MAG: hypothetical protein M1826_007780 [Phylliscum demangeonii]